MEEGKFFEDHIKEEIKRTHKTTLSKSGESDEKHACFVEQIPTRLVNKQAAQDKATKNLAFLLIWLLLPG